MIYNKVFAKYNNVIGERDRLFPLRTFPTPEDIE